MTERSPALLVVAGPNGSGKTTLTRHLMASGIAFGHYINPDDIAARLTGPYNQRVLEAQAIAEFERERCLVDRLDLSFETVMSHPSKLEFMAKARASGFSVSLFFVSTSDPAINVSRVANRVALGGHDVPLDRIVSRYGRTMSLLCKAAFQAHRAVIFDNSAMGSSRDGGPPTGPGGLRPVAEMVSRPEGVSVTLRPPVPDWLRTYLLLPLARADAAFKARHGVSAIRIQGGPALA